RRNLAYPVGEPCLKNICGWVNYGFSVSQELDKRTDVLRIQINRCRAISDSGKASGGSSVFHVIEQEVEHEVIDVLEFVSSCANELLGGHKSRNVAAHTQ